MREEFYLFYFKGSTHLVVTNLLIITITH